MKNLSDVASFCQDQAAYHAKKASWRGISPERAAAHNRLAEQFRQAADLVSDRPISGVESDALFRIDPFDMSDLPAELVEELAIPQSDRDEGKIIQLLRIAQRPLTINEIMVGLYRKFQETPKRTSVNARLYRMASREALTNPGKGTYGLPEWGHSPGMTDGGEP